MAFILEKAGGAATDGVQNEECGAGRLGHVLLDLLGGEQLADAENGQFLAHRLDQLGVVRHGSPLGAWPGKQIRNHDGSHSGYGCPNNCRYRGANRFNSATQATTHLAHRFEFNSGRRLNREPRPPPENHHVGQLRLGTQIGQRHHAMATSSPVTPA